MKPWNKLGSCLIAGILTLLATGCVVNDKTDHMSVSELQRLNKELEEKNMELLNQNQRLKGMMDNLLQKLSKLEDEREKMVAENMDLYQKLYKDRLSEQKHIVTEREKRLSELDQESSILLKHLRHNKGRLRQDLDNGRRKLVAVDAWTRDDQLEFEEICKKLAKTDLPPAQEEAAITQAWALQEQWYKRLDNQVPDGNKATPAQDHKPLPADAGKPTNPLLDMEHEEKTSESLK